MNQQNHNFSELDFDEVRQSIVEYLKTKTEFHDFDFEGSAISLLIDALAYAQTYMAVHANMAIGETFLQSARLRNNVVAKAKELGYTPRTITAAQAEFLMRFTGTTVNNLNPRLKRNAAFKANGKTFITLEEHELKRTDPLSNVFESNVVAYEGNLQTYSFEYLREPEGNPISKYELPDSNIDSRFITMTMTLQNGTVLRWEKVDNLVEVGPKSKVFFVQESYDGRLEIYFGDGVVGEQPADGTIFTVEYLSTKGPEGNGQLVTELTSVDDLEYVNEGDGVISLVVDERSQNGNAPERIESIRQNAPLTYQAQNRAVTKNDYRAILLNEFGFIEALNVWGGEDHIPPFYGSVFISIKPKVGDRLSNLTMTEIEQRLKERYSVMAIHPRVINPAFVYVRPNLTASYNPQNTGKNRAQIQVQIRDAVKEHFNSTVRVFDTTLRHSKLVEAIDDANPAILGSVTDIQISSKILAIPDQLVEYQLTFLNELEPGTLYSSPFFQGANKMEFKDNGLGFINLLINGKIARTGVGSIDYTTGRITISKYIFRSEQNFYVEFFASPVNMDIVASRNVVLRLDESYEITLKENKVFE